MTIKQKSLKGMLKRLWRHLSRKRRTQFIFLLLLMFLASFAEVISLGAVLPFLGALTSPESVFSNPVAQPLITFFDIKKPEALLLPMTVIFCVAILVASVIRLLLIWATTRLSFAAGTDISLNIYKRTLYQPYHVHVSRNSSEIIDGISIKSRNIIYNIILPTLTLISASVMLVIVLTVLVYLNPTIALSAFGGFGAIYLIIVRITKRRVLRDSETSAYESVRLIKVLQEGLGGIRDVLLDSSQHVYYNAYHKSDRAMRRAEGNSYFLSQSPRYGMEALGMVLIAMLAYSMTKSSDSVSAVVPTLGAFALGAQRLLPVLQQTYSSMTNIRHGQASLREIVTLLDQPIDILETQNDPGLLKFDESISFKGVSFKYNDQSDYIFKNLELTIKKGNRVGIIGTTGSGKSTLLDLTMGLLEPTEGSLSIDGIAVSKYNKKSWQKRVAHVPQAIFLSDTSIAQNIAFGIEQESIDYERVKSAAQKAQIDDLVNSLPEKYETLVGERGVRLSGGQRQRIGIARALYKQADIIIFDEATSALDDETEKDVMRAIESLSKELTILIVAHRVSTLKNCTHFVKVDKNKLHLFTDFEQVKT